MQNTNTRVRVCLFRIKTRVTEQIKMSNQGYDVLTCPNRGRRLQGGKSYRLASQQTSPACTEPWSKVICVVHLRPNWGSGYELFELTAVHALPCAMAESLTPHEPPSGALAAEKTTHISIHQHRRASRSNYVDWILRHQIGMLHLQALMGLQA